MAGQQIPKIPVKKLAAALVLLWAITPLAAQQPQGEDRTRLLWNTKFREKRPATARPASSPASSAPARPAPAAAPQPDPQTQKELDQLGDSLVGITVWKLREARAGDDQDVSLSGPRPNERLTPQRVEADTPLTPGDKVRVTVETARSGYLYVVDREQYADGSYGEPYLIFPTLRTMGGDNEVRAGRLVDIPSWNDSPPYFTMQARRPDQSAEVLTVLITPKPLQELRIGRDPLQLTNEQLAGWSSQWGVRVERLEARGQAGKAYTKAEKEAATDRTRLLTHEEPLPQTMYYLEAEPGNPLLLNVPLRIAR